VQEDVAPLIRPSGTFSPGEKELYVISTSTYKFLSLGERMSRSDKGVDHRVATRISRREVCRPRKMQCVAVVRARHVRVGGRGRPPTTETTRGVGWGHPTPRRFGHSPGAGFKSQICQNKAGGIEPSDNRAS
jgi:hypothetical protein